MYFLQELFTHFCDIRPIPAELCDMIIDYLWDDPAGLAACSLTCRSWLPAARHHLFGTVRLDTPESIASFDAVLHEQCSTLPNIAPFVRSLVLDMEEFLQTCEVDRVPEIDDALEELDEEDPCYEDLVFSLENMRESAALAIIEADARERLASANGHIARISKELKNIRSLTLRHMEGERTMLDHETLSCIISMSNKVEDIQLYCVLFEFVDQLMQLLHASSRLSSISLQNIRWTDVYSFVDIESYSNFTVEVDSRAMIKALHFTDCTNVYSEQILRRLQHPAFKLHICELSALATELNKFSYLLRRGSGNVVETLRLDYSEAFDDSIWDETSEYSN